MKLIYKSLILSISFTLIFTGCSSKRLVSTRYVDNYDYNKKVLSNIEIDINEHNSSSILVKIREKYNIPEYKQKLDVLEDNPYSLIGFFKSIDKAFTVAILFPILIFSPSSIGKILYYREYTNIEPTGDIGIKYYNYEGNASYYINNDTKKSIYVNNGFFNIDTSNIKTKNIQLKVEVSENNTTYEKMFMK